MLHQVSLIVRMQETETARRHPAQFVVINAKVIHTPIGQLMTVVQLVANLTIKNTDVVASFCFVFTYFDGF